MYCARGGKVRAGMLSLIKNKLFSGNLHVRTVFVKAKGFILFNSFIFDYVNAHFPRKQVHLVVKKGNATVNIVQAVSIYFSISSVSIA